MSHFYEKVYQRRMGSAMPRIIHNVVTASEPLDVVVSVTKEPVPFD